VIDDSRETVHAHVLHRHSLHPDQLRTVSRVNTKAGLLKHFARRGIAQAFVALYTPAGANPHAGARMGAMLNEQDLLPVDQQHTTGRRLGAIRPQFSAQFIRHRWYFGPSPSKVIP
jgi:hypothetical protein